MSYFEDYIEGGLCCATCGEFLDDGEPGHPRLCRGCAAEEAAPHPDERVTCPDCGKRVKAIGLAQHVAAKHPQQVVR